MKDARDDKSNNIAILVSSDNYADVELQKELRLEDVTPKLTKWFFQYPHLLKLNIFLGCALFGMVTQGYDGTLMGNLQTIPTWNSYFDDPSGERLSTLSNGVSIWDNCYGAILGYSWRPYWKKTYASYWYYFLNCWGRITGRFN